MSIIESGTTFVESKSETGCKSGAAFLESKSGVEL